MTRRTLWLSGIAIVLAILYVQLDRAQPRAASASTPAESPAQRRAAIAGSTLPSVLALAPTAAPTLDAPASVRVEGIVLTLDEVPVAGAIVHAGPRTTITDAAGKFAFADIAPGMLALAAEHGDLYGEDSFEIGADPEPIEIVVRAGPTLTVRVLSETTGAPIAGATVETMNRVATTDATGTAVLRAIESTHELIWVSAPGHVNLREEVGGEDARPLEATVLLAEALPIRGVVVGPDGERVPHARIRVDLGGDVVSVMADDDGAWEVDNAPAGVIELVAHVDGILAGPPVVVENTATHRHLEVQLAIEEASIVAPVPPDVGAIDGTVTTSVRGPLFLHGDEVAEIIGVLADGSFRIANVPVGSYWLEVWGDDERGDMIEVTIRANSTTQVAFAPRADD